MKKWAMCCMLSVATVAMGQVSVFYSPTVNLEAKDIQLLDTATKTIDISMYAFTDAPLMLELQKKASQGVQIRLYRDSGQFTSESKKPNNTSELLAQNTNVQIRVKKSRVLAHIKGYVVDNGLPTQFLREGSANWSPSGEKQQDNSLLVITDPVAVQTFETEFTRLWARPNNTVVQKNQ